MGEGTFHRMPFPICTLALWEREGVRSVHTVLGGNTKIIQSRSNSSALGIPRCLRGTTLQLPIGALRRPARAVHRAPNRIAVHPSAIISASGAEMDFVARKPAVLNRNRVAAGFQSSGDPLKSLLQCQLTIRKAPVSFHFRRHDPQKRRAPGV